MTALIHHWPAMLIAGRPVAVPAGARTFEGTLNVPRGLPAGVLAYMDVAYRSVLWPPARAEGYSRLYRQFLWSADGRVLHYRIVDVPVNPESRAERRQASTEEA